MPDFDTSQYVVRINDGNDSNVNRTKVIDVASKFPMKFYNTSIQKNFELFDAPIVLTVNPANLTDHDAYFIMMVLLNTIKK